MSNPFKLSEDAFSGLSLSGKYKRSWVEEAVDIDESERRGLAFSHTNRYLGSSISQKRIAVFLLAIGLGFAAIFSRVFYLQVMQGEFYLGQAEGNRIRLQPIMAERGIIYDRFGKELVQNAPNFSLQLVPNDVPRQEGERKEVISKIAEISGISTEEITRIIEEYAAYGYDAVTIKDNLDYDAALRLYAEHADLPGVHIESGTRRDYVTDASPSSTLSIAHILGYMGKIQREELKDLKQKGYLASDVIGRAGLEKTYEAYLRGSYGRKKVEVNALGKEQNVLAVTPPEPGDNMYLTIDYDAQRELERLVRASAEKSGNRRVAAIAMDSRTGEMLAMVSWPAFDNNQFAKGIDAATYKQYQEDKDRPLFNRVIGGIYPPGSTAKLVVSAAALEEKIVTRNTSFNSVGGINVGGILFKDWKAGGHGITNVTKAIAWSVNTFYYYVGGGYDKFVGLGVDKLTEYMRDFSMGKKTNVDLPGENAGFVPDKAWKKETKGEPWYVGDTYNISIGQGDLLTSPLQVAVWTAAVANNGRVLTPHFVHQVVNPVSKVTTTLAFDESKVEVSGANLQIVRDGMRECVTTGSCKLLGGLPFQAAGKTGTAQWSKTQPTHAWFTSFAPYKDPQVVVTVLVENGGEGASAAMPIAKDFLSWWGRKYLRE